MPLCTSAGFVTNCLQAINLTFSKIFHWQSQLVPIASCHSPASVPCHRDHATCLCLTWYLSKMTWSWPPCLPFASGYIQPIWPMGTHVRKKKKGQKIQDCNSKAQTMWWEWKQWACILNQLLSQHEENSIWNMQDLDKINAYPSPQW